MKNFYSLRVSFVLTIDYSWRLVYRTRAKDGGKCSQSENQVLDDIQNSIEWNAFYPITISGFLPL